MVSQEEVFTLDEAREFCKLHDDRGISRALKRGKLKGGKAGGKTGPWRVTKRALLDWIDDGMDGMEPDGRENEDDKDTTNGANDAQKETKA